MTKTEKKRFIRELMGNVRDNLLKKVDKMPDEWDRHEIRQLIADMFAHDTAMMSRPRMNAYKRCVLVNNLDR